MSAAAVDGDKARIRVAAVLGSARPARWQATALRELSEAAEAELSVHVAGTERGSRRGPAAALFSVYERLDRSLFGSGDDALSEASMPDAFSPEAFEPAALAESSPDVIVVLDAPHVENALRDQAPGGIWCLRFAGDRCQEGAPPLFWQLHRAAAVTEVTLISLAAAAAEDRVIYRSCLPTDPVSLHRARVRACAAAAHFPARCLAALRHDGLAALEERARLLAEPVEADARPRGLPSAGTLVMHLIRVGLRVARRVLRARFMRDDWRIGVRPHGGRPAESLAGLQVLKAPGDRSLADPFVFERGGRHWLFFEDYPWKASRASISFAEVRPDGQTGQSRTALRDEEHFAYPCVFEREGEVFMVPDRSKSGRLELYRAVAFPQRWQLEDVLMHGTVVDPTFFEHGDRLWLFASVDVEPVGPQKSELSLFHSRSLLGPWTPHPRNPVVTDVRRARPAGRPFRRGAELIRPGQDNSRGYGSAVTLSRVEVLDTEDYREIPIGRIGPERLPRACGLHTYNADSAYETIDFCRALPRLPLPRRRREG